MSKTDSCVGIITIKINCQKMSLTFLHNNAFPNNQFVHYKWTTTLESDLKLDWKHCLQISIGYIIPHFFEVHIDLICINLDSSITYNYPLHIRYELLNLKENESNIYKTKKKKLFYENFKLDWHKFYWSESQCQHSTKGIILIVNFSKFQKRHLCVCIQLWK